jgi:hypothetical protein
MAENFNSFDFELTAEEMQTLDGLTTPESYEAYRQLYVKCVVRDTPLEATNEGVKNEVTVL